MAETRDRLEQAAALIAERLNSMHFEWRADGRTVVGPGNVAIVTAARHNEHPNHVDVGFVLNRHEPEQQVVWDCTTGWTRDPDRALADAVDRWAQTSAPVWLELMTLKGDFADHLHGGDPIGFAGWHAIHGRFLVWGNRPGTEHLMTWCGDYPLLPALHASIAKELTSPELTGVRLYFGARPKDRATSEVQLNGVVSEGASATLDSLPWPRGDFAFARAFVLLVHPETSSNEPPG